MSHLTYLYAEKLTDAPQALVEKLTESETAKNWDQFYSRHENKFYKDRHYFEKEWPVLCSGPATLLEVGCGVGNTVFPLLDLNPALNVYACDFSSVAVDIVKSSPQYAQGRVQAFVADLTVTDLCAHVPEASVDFVTMVFVLSAVAPHKMPAAVANVARTLRPGGQLLFRDYEAGDLVQELRQMAGPPRKLGDRFFARGDGTCCFHFEQRELVDLMAAAGLTCLDVRVHDRDVENRKRGIVMKRRWLQASFQKTGPSPPFPPPPGSMPSFPPASTPTPPSPSPSLTPSTQTSRAATESPAHTTPASTATRPMAVDVTSVGLGTLAGTWLTGAAGRLASHAAELPGVASGRAQLPETLDSADELASQLSPATSGGPRRGRGRYTADSVGDSATVAMSNLSPRPATLEADLEREFFETVGRNTEDVVAEELAAAGVAGIRLADPFTGTHDLTALAHTQRHRHTAHTLSSATPKQQPSSQPTQTRTAQTLAQQQQPGQSDMDTDRVTQSEGAVLGSVTSRQPVCEIDIAPGLRFACPVHTATAGFSSEDVSGGADVLQTGPAQVELLLARLVLACVGAAPGLLSGGMIVQVATGPGALAGMTTVRVGGAKRVLLTSPSRTALQGLAQCVHANAARLVVERVKVAQLDWGNQDTIRNVLTRVAANAHCDLVLCGDPSSTASVSSGGTAPGAAGDSYTQLFQFAAVACRGEQLPVDSKVRVTRPSDSGAQTGTDMEVDGMGTPQGSRKACIAGGALLVLLPRNATQCSAAVQAAGVHGWRVDEGTSAQLGSLWVGVSGEVPVAASVQPVLFRLG